VEELLLAAGDVTRGIRVVDAEQHPVAEPPVGDGAQGVADMERSGRARRKTDVHRHDEQSTAGCDVDLRLTNWKYRSTIGLGVSDS